jgi:hypothetical protein
MSQGYLGYLGSKFKGTQETFEPMRNNNFALNIVLDTTAILEGLARRDENHPYIAMLSGRSDNFDMDITLSVASASAPNLSVDAIEVPYVNNTRKYAGKPSFGDSNVVINDFIGMDTELILLSWFSLVYDDVSEIIGLASEYKKTAYLYEFAPDGSNIRKWELSGIWPTSLEFGDYTQDGGDRRQLSMTLTMDGCQRIPV